MNFTMSASCKTALHAISVVVPIVTALILAAAWFVDVRVATRLEPVHREIAELKRGAVSDTETMRLLRDDVQWLIRWEVQQAQKDGAK